MNKEKHKYYKKYKPKYKEYFYIIAVIAFICGLFENIQKLDFIVNILLGALGSVVAALLLDYAECDRKNKEYDEKRKLIFMAYKNSMNELRLFPARRCINFDISNEKRTLKQWLYILANDSTYENNVCADSKSELYEKFAKKIQDVKNTINVLQEQYILLVEVDVVSDEKLQKHLKKQNNLCEYICSELEKNQYSHDSIRIVNEHIILLFENFNEIFPEYFEQKEYDCEICKLDS